MKDFLTGRGGFCRRIKPEEARLLRAARRRLPQLKALLAKVSGFLGYERDIHEFYDHSFMLFLHLPRKTLEIVEALQALAPHRKLNADFRQIVADGTKPFKPSDYKNWLPHTRPRVEAYFHARYMLEMACKYAGGLPRPPQVAPLGWVTFLRLYKMSPTKSKWA